MAKYKNFLVCLLCAVLCAYPAYSSPTLRDEVAATYTKEVGVREATGKNDGNEVEKYLKSVGLGKGYAWCGAFANWVLKQHQITTPKGAAMAMAWFPNSHTIWQRGTGETPQRADLFGLYYSHLKRIGHVGFVERWDEASGYAITVEGNTNEAGSREGDGVFLKRRLIRQIYRVSRWVPGQSQSKYLPAHAKTQHSELKEAIYEV